MNHRYDTHLGYISYLIPLDSSLMDSSPEGLPVLTEWAWIICNEQEKGKTWLIILLAY